MSDYLSDKLDLIIDHHVASKQANFGRLLGGALSAGRRMFGSAGSAASKVKPVAPKPAVPAAPFSPAKPATTAPAAGPRPAPVTPRPTPRVTYPKPAPKPAPAAPAPAAVAPKPTWGGRALGVGKAVGTQVALGGAFMGAPAAYDYFFPGQAPAPTGDPNDFYSQFSNFYNQNPAMASQVNPQLHSILSRQQDMRDYFGKLSSIDPMQPQDANPQAAAYSQQPEEEEIIPEERLLEAKQLLLKDEMQGEMQKFKQQRQKAVMDRLKTDPDGAAVIKHMETHGKPVTPETIKAEGQQLTQQHSQAQAQGDARPFEQWVSDMMQPQAQNFAFDAGVARRKMAGFPTGSGGIQAQLDAVNAMSADMGPTANANRVLNPLFGAGIPTAPSPAPTPRPTTPPPQVTVPTPPPSTVRGFVESKIPSWLQGPLERGSIMGSALDAVDAVGAKSSPPPAVAPRQSHVPQPPPGTGPSASLKPTTPPTASLAPKAAPSPAPSPTPVTKPPEQPAKPAAPVVPKPPAQPNVANPAQPQSNLGQRMRSMQTRGSLQNAFVKRY